MTTLTQTERPMEATLGDTQLGMPKGLQRLLQGWQQRRIAAAHRRRSVAADLHLWDAALADPRIMADITRAQDDHPGEVRKQRMMRTF